MSDLMGRSTGPLTTAEVVAVLPATFTQNTTVPGSGVAVTVPTSVALYRMVYGSVSMEAGDSVDLTVETGIATGVYESVQGLAISGADATATSKAAFSFAVKPGFRYKITLTGAAVIDSYSYCDV